MSTKNDGTPQEDLESQLGSENSEEVQDAEPTQEATEIPPYSAGNEATEEEPTADYNRDNEKETTEEQFNHSNLIGVVTSMLRTTREIHQKVKRGEEVDFTQYAQQGIEGFAEALGEPMTDEEKQEMYSDFEKDELMALINEFANIGIGFAKEYAKGSEQRRERREQRQDRSGYRGRGRQGQTSQEPGQTTYNIKADHVHIHRDGVED